MSQAYWHRGWAQYSSSLGLQVFAIVLGVIVSVLWFVVVNHLTQRLIERTPLLARATAGQPMNSVQPATFRPVPAGNVAVTPPQSTRSMQPVAAAKATTTQASTESDIDSSQFVIDEEAIYEQVANEVESGNVRKGLWTKLWAEADGDGTKVKLAYIRARVAEAQKEMEEARKAEGKKAEEIRAAKRRDEEALKVESIKERYSLLSQLPQEELAAIREKNQCSGAEGKFLYYIRQGGVQQVLELLSSLPDLMLYVDSYGNTPLHIVVKECHAELVKLFLSLGVDPDKPNNYGSTPRKAAEWGGSNEMVEMFQ